MNGLRLAKLIAAVVAASAVLYVGIAGVGPIPALGLLFDPADGLYRTARNAEFDGGPQTFTLDALDDSVTVVRDERFVPHIYATSDRDAIVALGYLIARDRLFQLDFVPRVAAGALSEAFGPGSVETDRFLRSTGMDWGAKKNLERIQAEGGIEHDLVTWYAAGVNAHLSDLAPEDLPIEFRLLGYEPEPFTPMQAMRVLQYMTYDLTYGSDDARYGALQRKLGDAAFSMLYPEHPAGLYVPIIPAAEMGSDTPVQDAQVQGAAPPQSAPPQSGAAYPGSDASLVAGNAIHRRAAAILQHRALARKDLRGTAAEGYRVGKGSNNWAVSGARSETGGPLLAGDMHLGLSLPPIWYEAHLVTPTMNAHGLTVPGAPGLVQAFTPDIGWTFTNTGADLIDHYAMEVDAERSKYRFDGTWRDLERVVDTIEVKGGPPVLDTLHYSHWGPVHFADSSEPAVGGDAGERLAAVAEQWVAHRPSRTLRALWGMVHADSLDAFEAALADWDTPMQNVLYAGRDGNIAIRSTGHLPIRRQGHGRGLLDGTSTDGQWMGRVPFGELPYSRNPDRKYLFSANQKPTPDGYLHYLNHDWRDGWRSLRIDTLLSSKDRHSVADFQAYQSDVDVQQRDAFAPLMSTATGVTPAGDSLRRLLTGWDGVAALDRPEPLAMDHLLDALHRLTWDEAVFDGEETPTDAVMIALADRDPQSRWFDVVRTEASEDAPAVVGMALNEAADSLRSRYGSIETWRWGNHHRVIFRHLTRSEQLRPLWRGPMPYPGFDATVSPARGRQATHSASQRLIVDFSSSPPRAFGVVPGGQSGDPLHPRFYDDQLGAYLAFEYYPLHLPLTPDALSDSLVTQRATLRPGGS